MSANDTPHSEDTTPEQELQRLVDELRAATVPLNQAIRRHLQGHEVDFLSAYLESKQRLERVVEQVSPATRQRGPRSYTPGELIDAYWDRVNERREYATTGVASLDRALSGGFDADRLIVLLGAPGSGKTTFCNQVADHTSNSRRPVLYITSEDIPHTLLAKTIARRGQIEYSAVLRGQQSERQRIDAALQEYRGCTGARFLRYVDATQGISLDAIYEQAHAHFHALSSEASGAPILIVDYLQRLSRFENLSVDARQSATAYTERLRAMACDLHCTTIVLSAMNRASGYHAGNSTLAAAKESGDIDYTADTIMAIGAQEDAAEEPAPGLRRWMLRIDKNRQGTTTYDQHHISLDWYAARQQFTEAGQDTTASSNASNGRNGRRVR
jgi:replicative DNA helicase